MDGEQVILRWPSGSKINHFFLDLPKPSECFIIEKETDGRCDIMPEEVVYTIEEVAKILKISTDTVRKMIADKELDAVKVRGQWRIKKKSVDRLLGN
jgi:excisionase family DNA binding protein